MRIFEFHFNPKAKTDLIFDSFCYEPENVYEKRMGGLYMIGILKNTLSQNTRFLDNLAKQIKEKYYKLTSSSPEKSLKESLRKANEFLEKIAREGDVSWLGNLSFAVVSFKNFELNFTKVGDLKLFLLRKGQIIDIDQKLKFEGIEPYPLKIFGSIVSGKLAEDDIILILTNEVYDSFLKENLLNEIAKLSLSASLVDGSKKLKAIFNSKREQLAKISGICLLILVNKEILAKEREILSPEKLKKEFSLKQVFVPLVKLFKKLKISPVKIKPPTKLKILPKLKIPRIKIKLPKFKPKIKFKIKTLPINKNLILILILVSISALGFFIFEKREGEELKIYQNQLNQIQGKIDQAEAFLIIAETNPQAENKANSLFKEAWEELSPLLKIAPTLPSDFSNQVFNLKNDISKNLYQLSKLVAIPDPEIIFEFNPEEFIPHKMVFSFENLYFFSPYAQNLFELNNKDEGKILSINKKFNLAVSLTDSVLLFSKPDQIINLKEGRFTEPISLETPYPDFNFNDLSSYRSNLYFLDNKNGGIIKYSYLGNLQWGSPQLWLSSEGAKDFRSLTIDGSIWVLTKNNSIERYYAGKLQETLELDLFPAQKVFLKVFTSSQLPYLYLLEPTQKRIVILNKSGQIVKQFQSEKFDNLLDFTVSEDGKTIYLLNGLKVYQVKF